MKQGKLAESVLKRSILKQLHFKRADVCLAAGVGEDCAAFFVAEDEVAVLSSDPVIWEDSLDGRCGVHANLNDLAAGGAQPVGLMLTALLPPGVEEPEMRSMVQTIAQECEPLQVQILGGHTEVTDAVNRPIVSMGGVRPGDDVIVTKWIGLEATAKLAHNRREELLSRYPGHLLDDAERFEQYFSIIPEAATAVKSGVRAMHDVTTGGIFGALWELAEASGVGLEIELKKIPIRQETVEICEFFDLNPYQLGSTGSLLLAAEDGNRLVLDLKQQGIPAVVIGKATAENDRVVINEEERRFLEPPRAGMQTY